MSSRAALESLLKAEVANGLFTHSYVAAGFLNSPEPVFEASYKRDVESTAVIFDLASLTKALVTGPLTWQLLKTHNKSVLTPLAYLLGNETWDSSVSNLPLAELLGHYAGLRAWWNFWMGRLGGPKFELSFEERERRIAEVFARIPPPEGKQDLYSDLGYILLGLGLEKIAKTDLSTQLEQWKLDIGFLAKDGFAYPTALNAAASTYIASAFCPLRGRLLQGEVHDENCASLGGVAGHAGLFASGFDLAYYLHCLWKHPMGRTYLEANEEQRLTTHHEGLLGLRRGGQGGSAASFAKAQGMGHLGFTGTAFWLHLPTLRYAIFLSNRVISGRVNPYMTELRRKVFGYLDVISS